MRILETVLIAGLVGRAAIAQVPVLDQTTLNGKFNFVYGVYQRSNASVGMGTLSFDGQGHYTAVTSSATSQGFYSVNPDGTGSLTNWTNPTLPPLSLRLGAGAAVVGASTLEQSTADQHDLMLAVPAATRAVAMNGSWGGVSFLYTPGPPVVARAGRFRLMFDGSGNVNSTAWTDHESDMNGGAPQDITSRGTYSVDATGTGTYASAQGTKRIIVSADGNTYIGTDTSAPEMIFATRLASGNPTSTGPQGRYWWLQLNAASPGGSGNLRGSAFAWALTNSLQGFEGHGSVKANGWGLFIDGPTGRLMDLAIGIGTFTVNSDSTVALAFGGLSSPGIGVISASNAALPWTNLSATATANYSFNIGIQGPSFQPASGQSVFLDPNGPMQAATHSAHPFPFAPGTLVVLRGSGLAGSILSANGRPLPTSLGSTSLTANGQAVGLVNVAPNAITFLMPWATAGAGKIKLKATVGGVDSNEITVRGAPASVGYFSTTGDGLGTIVAGHADSSQITTNSPAAAGETVVLYASGLGALANSVAEYDWPTSANPTSVPVQADVAGVQATVLYAGAAPGYPGVYQINIVIPPGATTSAGAKVRIFEGYAQTHPKVTIPIR
jgi:uncharacterized protein (TIGR03437 family)